MIVYLGDLIVVLQLDHSLLSEVLDHCVTHKIQELFRTLVFPLLAGALLHCSTAF